MAQKEENSLTEIKKKIKSKKMILGVNRTIKNIKLGKIKKVFLSANCPNIVKKDIKYYGKIDHFDVIELKKKNDELGVICKKPFSVSVLSLAK